jgi:hypothetical protein
MSRPIRIILAVLFSLPGSTGPVNAQERFQAMFYNVENYFDTVNRPDKQDDEFTPDGFKNWGFFKYRAKQNRIAKTIMAVGKWQMPEVIGLAEVENQQVLKDLLTFSPLERFNYRILHQQSPDWRGIDVAMLYRPRPGIFCMQRALPGTGIPCTFMSITGPRAMGERLRVIQNGQGLPLCCVSMWIASTRPIRLPRSSSLATSMMALLTRA